MKASQSVESRTQVRIVRGTTLGPVNTDSPGTWNYTENMGRIARREQREHLHYTGEPLKQLMKVLDCERKVVFFSYTELVFRWQLIMGLHRCGAHTSMEYGRAGNPEPRL